MVKPRTREALECRWCGRGMAVDLSLAPIADFERIPGELRILRESHTVVCRSCQGHNRIERERLFSPKWIANDEL